MDPPNTVVWAFVVELVLVLAVAFVWQWSDNLAFGEWLASWVLPALVLGGMAAWSVARSRAAAAGARWLGLTLMLGACGAAITCAGMTFIMLLSVIRTGFTLSWPDILGTLWVGVPSGAWLGAVVGLISGAVLSTIVLVTDRVRSPPIPEVRSPGREAALVAGVSVAALALVAELQHHVPAYLVEDCPSGCSMWAIDPWGRALAALIAMAALLGGVGLLAVPGRFGRATVGVLLVVVSWISLASGNAVVSSTFGPRFRRASLGLPALRLPVQRNLVGATLVEHPGVLWHSLEFRWSDGSSESMLVGAGPFRPNTDSLSEGFRQAIAQWDEAAAPAPRGR